MESNHKYIRYKTSNNKFVDEGKQYGGGVDDLFLYTEGITEQINPDMTKWLKGIQEGKINEVDFNKRLISYLIDFKDKQTDPFIDVNNSTLPADIKKQLRDILIFQINSLLVSTFLQINSITGKTRIAVIFKRDSFSNIKNIQDVITKARADNVVLNYGHRTTIPVKDLNLNSPIPFITSKPLAHKM